MVPEWGRVYPGVIRLSVIIEKGRFSSVVQGGVSWYHFSTGGTKHAVHVHTVINILAADANLSIILSMDLKLNSGLSHCLHK